MSDSSSIIRPTTPLYGINEVVYLRESAMLGFIEPAKVYRVAYDPDLNTNVYTFVYRESNLNTQIAGDANNLRTRSVITINEEDLLTFDEAIKIKEEYLIRELAKTRSLISLDVVLSATSNDITDAIESDDLIDFGDVAVGSSITKTFTITNNGITNVTFSDIYVISDETDDSKDYILVSSFTSTLVAGADLNFSVKFEPTDTGRRTSCLIFDPGFIIRFEGSGS
jgi:hypothetical protein